MSDSVQPGTEVDAELWQRFREEVELRRGGIRGHLRTEMENALRAYIDGGDATPAQVDKRLARIEAAVGVEATDGGTDTREPAQDTHTPDQVPNEKPHPRGDTEDKIRWLAEEVIMTEVPQSRNLKMIPKPKIRQIVDEEYGFNPGILDKYVGKIIDELELRQHPANDVVYVSDERYDEVLEEEREMRRDEAKEVSENL